MLRRQQKFLKFMKIKETLLLCATVMLFQVGMAQEDEEQKASLEGGSLKSQYEYLIDESNDFQEYKVIKKVWTTKFGNSLNDSIEAFEAAKLEARKLAKSQKGKVKELQEQLQSTQDSLNTVIAEKNSIKLVGMPMEKPAYKLTMWGIIGVLVLLLIVFIFRFKNSNVVAREAKENLDDVEEEFAEFKKRSLEREQKLRRELQDEINKQRGV